MMVMIDATRPRIAEMRELFNQLAPDYDRAAGGPGDIAGAGLIYEPLFDLADRADLPLVLDPDVKAWGGCGWVGAPGRRAVVMAPGETHRVQRCRGAFLLAVDDFHHSPRAPRTKYLAPAAYAVMLERMVPQGELARWPTDRLEVGEVAEAFGVTRLVADEALRLPKYHDNPFHAFNFDMLNGWIVAAHEGRRIATAGIPDDAPLNPATRQALSDRFRARSLDQQLSA